jgi:hypothetical protein
MAMMLATTCATAQIVEREENRADGGKLTVYTWTVHPAKPPEPAMKHYFVTRADEQTAGDAAALYNTAALLTRRDEATTRPSPSTNEALELPDGYLRVALDQLPIEDAKALLPREHLDYLDLAGTREQCEWDWTFRENGFNALLPQLSDLRRLNKWVCLRTRVAVREGRFDDAIASLRTSFMMARNIDRQGALINMLVGAGIANNALDAARECSAAANGPNLYWALADLPHPLFQIADAMEQERVGTRWIFRGLRRDAAMAQVDLDKVVADIGVAMSWSDTGQSRTIVAFAAAGAYSTAKQYLIDHGMNEAQVNALPPLQASLLYFQDTAETTFDDIFKWSRVPFWQGYGPMKAAVEATKEPKAVANPIDSLIANVHHAWASVTAVDRELAAQQIVESIRGYASADAGKPPASLDELKDLPVPLDPSTNKPFTYEAHENQFVLSSVNTVDQHDLRFEVTIAGGTP